MLTLSSTMAFINEFSSKAIEYGTKSIKLTDMENENDPSKIGMIKADASSVVSSSGRAAGVYYVRMLIEEGIIAYYERQKAPYTNTKGCLDCKGMIAVWDKVMAAIEDDKKYYRMQLRMCLPMPEFSTYIYHRLLCKDVDDVLHELTPPVTDPDLFGLYFTMNAHLQTIKTYVTALKEDAVDDDHQLIDIYSRFHVFVSWWISDAGSRLKDWARQAVSVDRMAPLSATDKHTSSVIDLFSMFSETAKFLVELDWKHVFGLTILVRLLEDEVGGAVQEYALALLRICAPAIKVSKPPSKKGLSVLSVMSRNRSNSTGQKEREENARPVVPLTTMYAALNNLDTSRQMLSDFCERNAEYVREMHDKYPSKYGQGLKQEDISSVAEPLKFIRAYTETIMNTLVDTMRPTITKIVKSLPVKANKKEALTQSMIDTRLEPLFAYFNTTFRTLSNALYNDVFLRVLRRIFRVTIDEMRDCLIPPDLEHSKRLSSEFVDFFSKSLPVLVAFFHADGQGLAMNKLLADSSLFQAVLDVYECTGAQLVSLYEHIESKGTTPADPRWAQSAQSLDSETVRDVHGV